MFPFDDQNYCDSDQNTEAGQEQKYQQGLEEMVPVEDFIVRFNDSPQGKAFTLATKLAQVKAQMLS